ncbi:MAG: fimbrillin family protein [Bacteroidales bacterium]|nr:fimbrillin family protein [Bacteroidales bacterium]
MNIVRVTCFALVASVFFASCSEEAEKTNVYDWKDGQIYFKTSLPAIVSSRANDMTLDRLESFQVTCFNTGDIRKDASGFVSPYFEDATFVRRVSPTNELVYESSPDENVRNWPTGGGQLKFFAFSPSRTEMATGNTAVENQTGVSFFNLVNQTTDISTLSDINYCLGRVRINPDISKQFDFVTAEASGERWKDFTNVIDLAFHHQLAQVELRAWGASDLYDFEIAGVRIGNPVVEGTFIFSGAPTSANKWLTDNPSVKDKVEYLYGNSQNTPDIVSPGDRIYYINHAEHNTYDDAGSIMGLGGCAMVIPTVNSKWEGLADSNILSIPYTTDKMYFSVLMRVAESATGEQIYPYNGNPYSMTVVYYAVDKAGTILARVYPGEKDNEYFSDTALTRPYVAGDGIMVKAYGWAAAPVDADWKAGKRYVYTLNYTDGIGVHDPQDPLPGKPIRGKASISWGLVVDDWESGSETDVSVPRK